MYSTTAQERLYSNRIDREGLKLYVLAFKISLVEALHVDLRKNKFGLRFRYKINTAYMKSLSTMAEKENQEYVADGVLLDQ